MTAKKGQVEFIGFVVITVLTMIGCGLCTAALLLPYWYSTEYTIGIQNAEGDIGLYQDRVCMAGDCKHHWHSDSDYDRSDSPGMPKFKTIRGLELAGVINAFMGLLSLAFVWCSRKGTSCWKYLNQAQYFLHTMAGAFLCVTGTLILSSETESGDIGIASIIAGAGSAMLFVPGCLSCLICRYDPTYGTLENPISPAFRNA